MPRILKKVLITLAALVLLLIALNYGVSYYITKKLPSILHAEKDFPYNISYEDLDISLIDGSFTIHNASIAPKDSTETALQQGVFGQVKRVEVHNFNLWALLRDDKIKVKTVLLDTPEVILYDRKKKYNVDDDIVKPFKNTISTGSVEIRNGNFKMLDAAQKISIKASNIDFKFQNIKVDSVTVEDNIPVKFTGYTFKCDSVFYRIDKYYDMTASTLRSNDTTVTVDNFKLVPKYSREAFTRSLALEKDLFAVTTKKISVPYVDWGYLDDVLFVHTPKVTFDNLHANIYRNKMPKDDPKVKPMYSELLRSIKFDLKADKILLRNSLIEYEEQVDFTRPAAKVTFANFYATISNVYSPVNKVNLPRTIIDAKCMFMKSTPFTVTWSFNTLDKNDAFTIKGHLKDIKMDEIDPISKPLMNVETTGNLTEVKFNFNGNRNAATGLFAIDYDDLKVDILKEDGKKKKKLLSAIANLFVKNKSGDPEEKPKGTTIEVTRLKDKSFFNFMWLCAQDGLKKTLLPQAVVKVLPETGKKKKKEKKKD